MKKVIRSRKFYESLELQISRLVQQEFAGQSLTPELLKKARGALLTKITEAFSNGAHKASPAAISWVTSQYFNSIKLNNGAQLKEMIIANDYTLAELPTSDIKILKSLFSETSIGSGLISEASKREQS